MTGTDPTVRAATVDDIDTLAEADPWPRADDWRRKVDAGEVVVAEFGGEIVGHLRADLIWSTVPFLALIEVRDTHRGRGISRLLLGHLEGSLRDRGYVALLSSSQTDEPEAQRWHVHMGFHTAGIIEHVADDDVGEVVYRKLL